MKYSVLEKNLIEKLNQNIKDVTPGVMVRAYQNGRVIADVSVGTTYAYYDFASLTKIIFTVQALMLAFDKGKWNLDTKVSSFLDWFPNKDTSIVQLLNHSSGLPWWMPVYKEMSVNWKYAEKRNYLKEKIRYAEFTKSGSSVYSDVGFWVLGFILEKIFDKSLIEIWTEIAELFYVGTTLNFHVDNKPAYNSYLYAPSEECGFRKKLIQGEVHDENCWAFGGVSTHAGLFGSLDDLAWFALNLRSQLLGIARYSIKQKTAQLFAKRSLPEGHGDWALGYMLPSATGSSAGDYMSPSAIGHTGFTGTSMWYDAKADVLIAVLSNRLVYGRENNGFKNLRPKIHNWIIEGLRKSSI